MDVHSRRFLTRMRKPWFSRAIWMFTLRTNHSQMFDFYLFRTSPHWSVLVYFYSIWNSDLMMFSTLYFAINSLSEREISRNTAICWIVWENRTFEIFCYHIRLQQIWRSKETSGIFAAIWCITNRIFLRISHFFYSLALENGSQWGCHSPENPGGHML